MPVKISMCATPCWKPGESQLRFFSVIGASVNYQLLSDVGTVAWHAYRRRFVLEVAHHRKPAGG